MSLPYICNRRDNNILSVTEQIQRTMENRSDSLLFFMQKRGELEKILKDELSYEEKFEKLEDSSLKNETLRSVKEEIKTTKMVIKSISLIIDAILTGSEKKFRIAKKYSQVTSYYVSKVNNETEKLRNRTESLAGLETVMMMASLSNGE